jgi:hypothetical protein
MQVSPWCLTGDSSIEITLSSQVRSAPNPGMHLGVNRHDQDTHQDTLRQFGITRDD